MKKELKEQVIAAIKANMAEYPNFYITDIAGLNAEDTSKLVPTLEGNTAIMYCEAPAVPAKLIKKYMKAGAEKPALKGAYVQECAFVGADKLEALINIKSREELIGNIVAMLQSPIQNVVSALQNGGGQIIAGLVKTLEEKEN